MLYEKVFLTLTNHHENKVSAEEMNILKWMCGKTVGHVNLHTRGGGGVNCVVQKNIVSKKKSD